MPVENPEKLLLSLTGLSRTLGIGRTATYKLLNKEQLPASVVLNGRRYWLLADIKQWLENLKEKTR